MKKAIMRYVFLLSIFVTVTPVILAQQFPCGTTVTQAQKDFEASLTDSITQLLELNRKFHLAVYIVEDNKGQPNINPADINAAISQLNTSFEPIKATFSLHSVTYIDNYNFDEIRMGTNEQDLITQYSVRNTINIYLVLKLYNNADMEICGYTYYPADTRDVILLNKSCFNGTFLTEQIGHFFNLYHTHETTFGNEFANGSNCGTAGDLCCDTPADPLLTINVSPDCQYTGTNNDSMGNYYQPTTANYMSFSPLNCRCYFSDKQYRRMINCMQQVKQYLW